MTSLWRSVQSSYRWGRMTCLIRLYDAQMVELHRHVQVESWRAWARRLTRHLWRTATGRANKVPRRFKQLGHIEEGDTQ